MKYAVNPCVYRLAIGLSVAWVLGGASAWAQAPVFDLTGERCLGSSLLVDPDGPGDNLPPAVYCVMNGRLPAGNALEMDDIDGFAPVAGNPASVADANLYPGATANDPNLPDEGAVTYLDWSSLGITNLTGPNAAPLGSVENHRILDFTANDDHTILSPSNASCLNDGSALPKEDFTESYIANTNTHLYFGQERRTNNGNSVYYWILSQNPPIVVPGAGGCGGNTRGQVQFKLTAGDVELLVNFPDSSDPASGAVFFRSFTGADTVYIPAATAVFHPDWGAEAAVDNIAVNIATGANAGDDAFGPWGGIDSHGDPVATGTFTTASFAEWAVDLNVVFGGAGLCGKQLFVTGLSRASTGQVGSIDEPSSLKDIVGPKLYSFGQMTASLSLTPSCSLSFGYTASAVDIDGVTPIPAANLTSSLSCTDGDGRGITLPDPPGLSGTGTIPRGDASPDTIECTVTLTDTNSGCSDDATASTTVYAPILVTIAPDAQSLACQVPAAPGSDNDSIAPGVTYSATISGGDASYTRSWTVTGPNSATCGSGTTCVIDVVDSTYCSLTTVKVGVDDGQALCPAVDSETETVTKLTAITATNQ